MVWLTQSQLLWHMFSVMGTIASPWIHAEDSLCEFKTLRHVTDWSMRMRMSENGTQIYIMCVWSANTAAVPERRSFTYCLLNKLPSLTKANAYNDIQHHDSIWSPTTFIIYCLINHSLFISIEISQAVNYIQLEDAHHWFVIIMPASSWCTIRWCLLICIPLGTAHGIVSGPFITKLRWLMYYWNTSASHLQMTTVNNTNFTTMSDIVTVEVRVNELSNDENHHLPQMFYTLTCILWCFMRKENQVCGIHRMIKVYCEPVSIVCSFIYARCSPVWHLSVYCLQDSRLIPYPTTVFGEFGGLLYYRTFHRNGLRCSWSETIFIVNSCVELGNISLSNE